MWLHRKRKTAPHLATAGPDGAAAGLYCLWICGTNDLLPIMGMKDYPFIHLKFVPLGNLAANLYAVLVAYSVLQHELLDIHITMSKAAARLVRLSFVFLIALVLLLAAWMAAPQAFTAILVRHRAGGGGGEHQRGVGIVPAIIRQRGGL